VSDIVVRVDGEGYGKVKIGEQWYAVVPFGELSQNQLIRVNVGSGDLYVSSTDWWKFDGR
jgi:hypothetical protein